jgi:hypothetical protein
MSEQPMKVLLDKLQRTGKLTLPNQGPTYKEAVIHGAPVIGARVYVNGQLVDILQQDGSLSVWLENAKRLKGTPDEQFNFITAFCNVEVSNA